MGIPKFFRWLNERYEGLLVTAKDYQLPEIENFYLDMNGIIHNCTHPNDGDVHFRISEAEMFEDIFNYIDTLFKIIQPKQYFFMAVDGVAPRAKMNQQRGRRFKSAKEAIDRETKAIKKGDILPSQQRFDSNCITPGTTFMIKLSKALKHFVVMKMTTDDNWKQVKVILSGHETPGEGEHKIMDFIRYQRSQPNYNPDTRHCLYGLDTDLIMLGLSSHEPNFMLLREDIKISNKRNETNKRQSIVAKRVDPTKISFNVLYISMLRDYIERDFIRLKPNLSFKFDLEAIIDDWILICFLVGNDFIPNIAHFHIHKSALPKIFSVYQKALTKLDGYMNEHGKLNLRRFRIFARELSELDLENYRIIMKEMRDGRRDTRNESRKFQAFKMEYYREKFKVTNPAEDEVLKIVKEYVRALQWNLRYYYQGCVSWSWFYPYHYAPFISDVVNFKDVDLHFERGEPFKPYDQLLSVLPPASCSLLPRAFQGLVLAKDSPLKQFFPLHVDYDLNGKQNEWEAVVLAPFIEEESLLKATNVWSLFLSQDEKSHNVHGPHLLYYTDKSSSKDHPTRKETVKIVAVDAAGYNLPANKIKYGLLKKPSGSSLMPVPQRRRNYSVEQK